MDISDKIVEFLRDLPKGEFTNGKDINISMAGLILKDGRLGQVHLKIKVTPLVINEQLKTKS